MTVKRIIRYRSAWAAAFAGALLLGACQASRQIAVVDVDPASWNGPAGLSIENTDTVSLRDIELFVRCNDRFDQDTLTVRITTLSSDTLRCEELLPLYFPHIASAAALAREHIVPYRRRVCFSHVGCYRMTITPTRSVAGVEAVGISIGKSI